MIYLSCSHVVVKITTIVISSLLQRTAKWRTKERAARASRWIFNQWRCRRLPSSLFVARATQLFFSQSHSGVVVAFASFLKHSVLFTGVDPDYDGALADINATKGWFDKYLKKQCAALGCKVSNKLGVLDLKLHGAKPSLSFVARYQ